MPSGRAPSAAPAETSGSGTLTALEEWWSGETAREFRAELRTAPAGPAAPAALGPVVRLQRGGTPMLALQGLAAAPAMAASRTSWALVRTQMRMLPRGAAGTALMRVGGIRARVQEVGRSGRLKGEAALDALQSALAAECGSEVRRLVYLQWQDSPELACDLSTWVCMR